MLQNPENYSISKVQMALQIFSYSIYSIAYIIYVVDANLLTYYTKLSLDWLSLLILMCSLMHVADLQLKYKKLDVVD